MIRQSADRCRRNFPLAVEQLARHHACIHVYEASAVLLFVFTSAVFTSVLIPLLPRGMSFVYFWRKNTPSLKR